MMQQIKIRVNSVWGMQWHSGFRQKVTGSVPDWVIKICRVLNPSGRTTAMESTQSLTEKSTRNISWGLKAAGA